MKNNITLIIIIILLIIMSGCAPNIDITTCTTNQMYLYTYGFFGGLWHGFIVVFSFIVSLFNADIAMYAVNNNGGWYNFGFILGSGALSIFGRRRVT